MQRFKRVISIMLCLCMAVLLYGCGNEDPIEASEVFTAETAAAMGTAAPTAAQTNLSAADPASYQAARLPLPERMDDALDIRIKDGTLYLYGRSLEDETVAGRVFISDVSRESDSGSFLLPEDGMTDMQPCADGGLWIMTSLWRDKNYQGTRFTLLSPASAVEREFLMDKDTYPESPRWMLLDEERSCLYILDWQTLYALDHDGNELFRLSNTMGGAFFAPCFTADGRLAVLERGDAGQAVLLLDADDRTWGGSVELSVEGRGMYDGSLYDLYIRDEQMLYGLDLQTGELTPILQFLDAGMGSDVRGICALAGGPFVVIANMVLYFVSPTDDSSVTTLTLATTLEPILIEGAVLDFNTSQSEYKIVVKDYSQYNTSESDTAGLEQLGLDIAAGEIPDLFDLHGIPLERYAALGLLEDLYPYLDADAEFSRGDLVPSFLSAMETDGKLYFLAPHFCIRTFLAPEGALSDDWTFSDLLTLANGVDPFADCVTRYDLLRDMAGGAGSPFVDWTAGTCSFDSRDFIDLLRFAALLPTAERGRFEEYGPADHAPALQVELIGSPISLLSASAFMGTEVDAAGFPGSGGTRYLAEPVREIFAMSAQSAHKDGAWAFLRTMLSERKQSENMIPITQASFDAAITEEKQYIESGAAIELPGADGEWREYPFTMENLNAFEDLINSVTGVYEYDPALMEIIWSEAQAYFAGDKTAEDTAGNIQSRVGIYMAEQG